MELGIEAVFHEYVAGNLILKGESLDTDDYRIFWNDRSISIQKDGFPLYFVGGKKVSHWVCYSVYLFLKKQLEIGLHKLGSELHITASTRDLNGRQLRVLTKRYLPITIQITVMMISKPGCWHGWVFNMR